MMRQQASWSQEEIDRIEGLDEVRIRTRRSDGSLRAPVIIWIVEHEGALYVRSVRGRDSAWFKGAKTRMSGSLEVARLEVETLFEEEHSAEINDAIDLAYAEKYHRYAASIVASINSAKARAATLRLSPAGELS